MLIPGFHTQKFRFVCYGLFPRHWHFFLYLNIHYVYLAPQGLSCDMQDPLSLLQHVGSSSLSRD